MHDVIDTSLFVATRVYVPDRLFHINGLFETPRLVKLNTTVIKNVWFKLLVHNQFSKENTTGELMFVVRIIERLYPDKPV
jgi:hypothetical protein